MNLYVHVFFYASTIAFLASCSGIANYASQESQKRSTASKLGVEDVVPEPTIDDSPLKGLNVSINHPELNLGDRAQAKAVGLFLNGTVKDITEEVEWSIANESVATISTKGDNAGLIVSLATGESKIVAKFGEIKENVIIKIGEPVAIALRFPGQTLNAELAERCKDLPIGNSILPASNSAKTVQLKVFALMSDCSEVDKTDDAAWSSSDTGLASFSSTKIGFLSLKNAGTIVVTAQIEALNLSVQQNFAVKYQNPLSDFTMTTNSTFVTAREGKFYTVLSINWTPSANAVGYYVSLVRDRDDNCPSKPTGEIVTTLNANLEIGRYQQAGTVVYACVLAASSNDDYVKPAENNLLRFEVPNFH